MSGTLAEQFRDGHEDERLLAEEREGSQLHKDQRAGGLEQAYEELKQAQAELERRWKYLAEAQRLSHSGIFGWKVQSGELVWSDETYRILGFVRETSPTLDLVFDRIHPEDRYQIEQLRDRAAQSGMDLDFDHRLLMPDGAVKYLHVVAHAGRDSSGHLEYMGVVTEVTERKRAEEERETLSRNLQESKARLEEAQRVAGMGHYHWDLVANRVVWSEELYRIYGLTLQDGPIDMAMVQEMIHPDDRERVFLAAEEAVRGGVNTEAEHRVIRPDGEVRSVLGLGTVKRDASGRAYEMFGTVQDITERRRAEEERETLLRELQESNAWLEEAQRVAHIGYWVWDLKTNRLICSDEYYRIHGLTPRKGSIELAAVTERIHPEDRDTVLEIAEEAIRSGAHADCTHRLLLPNGETRVVHSLADLKKDSSGRPYQMFGTTQDVTDQKRAEEERQTLSSALRQSNERLEEAQRVAVIGHYELNPAENQVTWSAELCRIYGIAPIKDPIDLAVVFEMVHPEDREYAGRIVEETLRSGNHLKAEHRIVRSDGEVRFLQILGTVKRDVSGRAYELFGTCQDITDRKLAEQALWRSQFYLREGERLAHLGSWAFDESGHYWSEELYKIYGLNPNDGPPSPEKYLALVHPHDRASMAETIRLMQEEHRGFDQIERIIRPDGQLRYIRVVAVPVNEGGVFKGFVGTTRDVTEQELLTQELRREKAYLAESQSQTHVGSWACNLLTREIFHSSDENARLYGFDPSQGPIPFDLFYDSILPEDEREIRGGLQDAINSRADYDVEFRIQRKDGAIRYLRGIGHHDAAKEIGEYVGITMDVTDRKHAETERERLRQVEADLAHINRVNMMGELAAALAHEIKQPIAASITSANALTRWLAHDPPDLGRARAAAARIEQDANRAADVITSLQSFYRSGSPADQQSVSIEEIAEEMTLLLRTEAVRHSVKIKTVIEPELPRIRANRVQLQQVFMNLMLNALEAMKDIGGELTVRSRLNSDGRQVVSISDTGVGLPVGGAEHIFDAFQTTKPQGTGMGLTITRSIVEAYGGRVWATANQGPGATFHFILPAESEAHV
jgi:PAS domain S-box-containing protein